MLFKTHPSNIAQIRAVVGKFGGCYFHGDGNLYAVDALGNSIDSDFRKDFSNDSNEEARYRVRFMRGDSIPKTVEELNKMLFDSKNQEILTRRAIKDVGHVKTVEVEDTHYEHVDHDAEVDYSKYDRRKQ